MPAHKKSLALHTRQGSYRSDRHDARAKQAENNQALPEPVCPPELPDKARKVFQWLVSTYPGLREIHTPLLAQASVLYAMFQENPDGFQTGQHNQLRLLFKEIQQIAMEEAPKPEDAFDRWQMRRALARTEREV